MSKSDQTNSLVDYDNLMAKITARSHRSLSPINGHLEVTKSCPLDCIHCYVDHQDISDQLNITEIQSVLDQFADLGVLFLSVSGGEPLLRPDIWEILKYAREKKFAVRLFTSGYLINNESADKIKNLGVGEVHISVYSADPTIHNKICRNNKAFEKSMRAIKLLGDRNISVVFKCVIMKDNYKDIASLANLASDMGAKILFDSNLFPAENDVRDSLSYRLDQDRLNDFLADPENASILYENGDVCGLLEALRNKNRKGVICTIGRQHVYVTASGEVQPCQIYPPIGNIRKQLIKEIWFDSEIIKELRNRTYEDQKHCSSCQYVSYCTPCMGVAELEHGDSRECSSGSKMHAIAQMNMDLLSNNKQSDK